MNDKSYFQDRKEIVQERCHRNDPLPWIRSGPQRRTLLVFSASRVPETPNSTKVPEELHSLKIILKEQKLKDYLN